MDLNLARAIATLAAAVMCMRLLRLTKGERGIGWFIVALLIIW